MYMYERGRPTLNTPPPKLGMHIPIYEVVKCRLAIIDERVVYSPIKCPTPSYLDHIFLFY